MPTTTRSKRKHQEAELEGELLRCSWRGDFDRVHELVEIDRVSIECTSPSMGRTPLILAANFGRMQVVRYLLQKGANIQATDRYGNTALLQFVMFNGHVEIAQLLLENDANVEARCPVETTEGLKYFSPLGLAIYLRDADMVALLLQFGANTAETLYANETNTALYAACRNANAEIVQLLLNHNDGVDINTITRVRDFPAMSFLCVACRNNDLEVAQLLIQHGARVIFAGASFPDSPCPLKHAVENGSLELVQFLLDNSRLQLPEEILGDHPLSPPLGSALSRIKLEAAQLLVDRGANVNDRPFLYECAKVRNRSLEPARFLLRNGADVNLADNDTGETPLWAAAENGQAELVKELLKARADVNIRDHGGDTPIWVAYRRGHKRVVYLLLRTSPRVWPKLSFAL